MDIYAILQLGFSIVGPTNLLLYLNRAEERRKFSITGNAHVNGYARRSSARF